MHFALSSDLRIIRNAKDYTEKGRVCKVHYILACRKNVVFFSFSLAYAEGREYSFQYLFSNRFACYFAKAFKCLADIKGG